MTDHISRKDAVLLLNFRPDGKDHQNSATERRKFLLSCCTCITEVGWKRQSRRMTLRSYFRLMLTFGNTKEGTLFSGHCELVMPEELISNNM